MPVSLVGAAGLRLVQELGGRERGARGGEARVDQRARQQHGGGERHDQPHGALAGGVHAASISNDGQGFAGGGRNLQACRGSLSVESHETEPPPPDRRAAPGAPPPSYAPAARRAGPGRRTGACSPAATPRDAAATHRRLTAGTRWGRCDRPCLLLLRVRLRLHGHADDDRAVPALRDAAGVVSASPTSAAAASSMQ